MWSECFLQEAHLIPARLPVGAAHLREIGEDADGLMLALVNQELDLRFEGLDVLVRHFANDLESQYSA